MKTAELLNILAPWDHEVDGVGTIKPTVGLVVAIENLKTTAKPSQIQALAVSLFPEGQGPDWNTMEVPIMMAILMDYSREAGEYLRKNSARLAAAINPPAHSAAPK